MLSSRQLTHEVTKVSLIWSFQYLIICLNSQEFSTKRGVNSLIYVKLVRNLLNRACIIKPLMWKGAYSIFDTGLDDQKCFWLFPTTVVSINHKQIHLMSPQGREAHLASHFLLNYNSLVVGAKKTHEKHMNNQCSEEYVAWKSIQLCSIASHIHTWRMVIVIPLQSLSWCICRFTPV